MQHLLVHWQLVEGILVAFVFCTKNGRIENKCIMIPQQCEHKLSPRMLERMTSSGTRETYGPQRSLINMET